MRGKSICFHIWGGTLRWPCEKDNLTFTCTVSQVRPIWPRNDRITIRLPPLILLQKLFLHFWATLNWISFIRNLQNTQLCCLTTTRRWREENGVLQRLSGFSCPQPKERENRELMVSSIKTKGCFLWYKILLKKKTTRNKYTKIHMCDLNPD